MNEPKTIESISSAFYGMMIAEVKTADDLLRALNSISIGLGILIDSTLNDQTTDEDVDLIVSTLSESIKQAYKKSRDREQADHE